MSRVSYFESLQISQIDKEYMYFLGPWGHLGMPSYQYTYPTTQHFPSFLFTSIINWKANTVHKNILTRLYKKFNSSYIFVTHPDKFDILWNQGYTKSLIKLLYFWQTSLQIWDTLKPRLYKKLNQVCISWKFGHQVMPLA